MTKCEELQLDLALFSDGSLTNERRTVVESHLPECPLCRQKLAEYEVLATDLRGFPRFAAPSGLIDAIRASAEAQLATVSPTPTFRLIDRRHRWSEIWLMPSVVGCAATVVLAFTLASFILTAPPEGLMARTAPKSSSASPLANNLIDLTPDQYAHTRLAIAGESPSINPQGALVALTRSLVRGEMRDDEVTVVADVFGNGLAEIAEVVEPSRDDGADRKSVV